MVRRRDRRPRVPSAVRATLPPGAHPLVPLSYAWRVHTGDPPMTCRAATTFLACLLTTITVFAQRPADAPETAPSGTPPDTVMLEELTWAETRDLVKSGWTTILIGTAGTEQKGPHMADGEHKFVMTYTADKIARAMGRTLVAPVVTYVPEGSRETLGGHMGKPGTITLPEDRFVD